MCRIIALSGIDGSGKSTCIDIINSLLHEQGANKIVIYDSMNQGVFSEMLKHISSRRGIPFRTLFSPELINIVWMSDLIYIFDQLIKPAMADNDYIILHRSELCCRVYSRLFNPCSNTIDRCLDGFSFNYDLNIFLDIDPSIAYERICERKKRYPITEKESRKMLSEADRLYKKYLLLPPYCDMQRVNTGCSINNVESQLRKIINNLICDNHDTAEANVGKICTIIRETLGLDQSEPINRETLMTDLPFDSLRYVQMIVKIEDEFNIKFDEFSLIQSPTASVGSLVELVKNHGQTV